MHGCPFYVVDAFAGTMLGRSYYSPTTCPLGVEGLGDARGRLGAYEDLGIALRVSAQSASQLALYGAGAHAGFG